MTTLTALFLSATLQTGLPANLLSSLCYVESAHKINAIHHDDGNGDSLGVCQIKYPTAKMMGFKGTSEQLMLPKNNIKYAAKYLAHQIKRYNGDVTKAVIAYNQGSAKNLTSTKYSIKVFKQWRKQNNVR